MQIVLYIHGFLSSPSSSKAQQTKAWLAQNKPETTFLCPQLSSYPHEAKAQLLSCIEPYTASELCVIGSSLGGFWASHLVEEDLARKAVLINPAVAPHLRFKHYIGEPLKSYYSDDVYTLKQSDIGLLGACESPRLSRPQAYWLLAQKEDEVLDYRLAQERYASCKSNIEDGGNHIFIDYSRWLPEIATFFEAR
jgi:hypothetical protein